MPQANDLRPFAVCACAPLLPRPVPMTDKTPSEKTQRPIVLIVEDELFVRMDAANIIEKAGFGVVEACNADEAIEILEGRDDISVVVTDVAMPGSMDGVRLAA